MQKFVFIHKLLEKVLFFVFLHLLPVILNIYRTTRQPFVFTTILRRTSFKIEKAASSSIDQQPLTTSTKRQPKVVPQFDVSSTTRSSSSIDSENRLNDKDKYLVDGFVVGKPPLPSNDIDKDHFDSR